MMKIAALLLAAGLQWTAAAAAKPNEPVVRYGDGAVRGFVSDGVEQFRGLPYAAPPLGELRWMPPASPKPWKGVRDATRFGSTCPQVTTLGVFAGPTSVDEDCLFVNVYTTSTKGAKKPVIVWIYGGGNINGAANDYDGAKLATGGPEGVPTVVVTMNYRVGLFGSLSHPAINAASRPWGNYLMLDQQAALRWVKRNISAFGGDPDNVTLGGQSAGAINVMANILSPLAKDLFQRAIVMSSPGFAAWFPDDGLTQTMGRNFANAAGCPGDGEAAARCLRALPAARVLQLQGTIGNGGPYNHGQPFIDGTVLTMSPENAWTSGNFNKVPIMGGGTRDEAMFFYAGSLYLNTASVSRTGMSVPRTAEDFATATSPGAFCIWCNAERKMPPGVANLYPVEQYNGDAMYALARVGTDGARCRELHVISRIAEAGVPVYAYEFAYDQAPFYFPRFPGYSPRAVHTGDLQFVFNDFHGGHLGVNLDQTTGMPRQLNAEEIKLSNLMVAQWTRFAHTGNPNGSGDTPWPRFKPDASGQVFVQSMTPATMSIPQFRADKKCDFFDPQLKY